MNHFHAPVIICSPPSSTFPKSMPTSHMWKSLTREVRTPYPRLVSSEGPDIPNLLAKLFSLFMEDGCCPYQWKNSLIIPIDKMASLFAPANYRPNNFIQPVPRIVRRFIMAKPCEYLLSSNLITKGRRGFLETGYLQTAWLIIWLLLPCLRMMINHWSPSICDSPIHLTKYSIPACYPRAVRLLPLVPFSPGYYIVWPHSVRTWTFAASFLNPACNQ